MVVMIFFLDTIIMRRFLPSVFSWFCVLVHRQNLYQLNEIVYVHTDDQYIIESLTPKFLAPQISPVFRKQPKPLINMFSVAKMRLLSYWTDINEMLKIFFNWTIIYNFFCVIKKRKWVKQPSYMDIFAISCLLQTMVLE